MALHGIKPEVDAKLSFVISDKPQSSTADRNCEAVPQSSCSARGVFATCCWCVQMFFASSSWEPRDSVESFPMQLANLLCFPALTRS